MCKCLSADAVNILKQSSNQTIKQSYFNFQFLKILIERSKIPFM